MFMLVVGKYILVCYSSFQVLVIAVLCAVKCFMQI